jgi:hypothetical protein
MPGSPKPAISRNWPLAIAGTPQAVFAFFRRELKGRPDQPAQEMIMQRRDVSLVLILGAAAAVLGLGTLWMLAAGQERIGVAAILPFAVSALLMAGVAWKVRPSPGTLAHYLRRHEPLAGPRPGAELPQ